MPPADRLTAPAPAEVRGRFTPPPFPAHAAPTVLGEDHDPDDPLPHADVVVVTYTAAEHQAMADVLTPGLHADRWTHYAHRYDTYEPDLTGRSPARDVHRLGEHALVELAGKRVVLFHSQLHLATDSTALPLRRLFRQVIGETSCRLIVDTGTAGGIGVQVQEGDTVAAGRLVFDCTAAFAREPWAHHAYPTTAAPPADWGPAEELMRANAHLLHGARSDAPLTVWPGDVITCDSFLFDAAGDPYGLEVYDDGRARAEEMDAAVLGLVAGDLGGAMPQVASLRSVSDPRIPALPGGIRAEKRRASQIYDRYGYAAQVATLCAVWQLITCS